MMKFLISMDVQLTYEDTVEASTEAEAIDKFISDALEDLSLPVDEGPLMQEGNTKIISYECGVNKPLSMN